MTATLPLTVTFRRAVPTDFPEVRHITRDAYLRAGHFAADHPYMIVLENVEHRAEHAEVWVAEGRQGGGGGDADVRGPAV